jgi:hypothetical protein
VNIADQSEVALCSIADNSSLDGPADTEAQTTKPVPAISFQALEQSDGQPVRGTSMIYSRSVGDSYRRNAKMIDDVMRF